MESNTNKYNHILLELTLEREQVKETFNRIKQKNMGLFRGDVRMNYIKLVFWIYRCL